MNRRVERCAWAEGVGELYLAYHDTEWGVPVHDDRRQFEFLILEGAQAGLSWSTVLNKREAYRKAFAGFDPARVARFDARKLQALLRDPGIIRNRLKVAAAVTNARAFLAVSREFGSFDRYIWGFVGGRPIRNRRRSMKDLPATSEGMGDAGNLQGPMRQEQAVEWLRLPRHPGRAIARRHSRSASFRLKPRAASPAMKRARAAAA